MDLRLTEGPDGVRRFTDAAVNAAVEQALAGIEGKALVFDADVDSTGVRGVFAVKYPNGWSIGLVGEVDPRKGWGSANAGIRVKKVWK